MGGLGHSLELGVMASRAIHEAAGRPKSTFEHGLDDPMSITGRSILIQTLVGIRR